MNWGILLANRARKELRRIPAKERGQVLEALKALSEDPMSGDVRAIQGGAGLFRRRVGSWRIIFELYNEKWVVIITAIKRRTSNTY